MDHKDNHNLLIDFEYDNFDFLNENEAVVFKSAIKKIDTPDFLNKDLNLSDEEKIIKLSIYLTEEKPYKTYILADNDLEKKIKANAHFNKIFSVAVFSEEKAIGIINEFDELWKNNRKISRL